MEPTHWIQWKNSCQIPLAVLEVLGVCCLRLLFPYKPREVNRVPDTESLRNRQLYPSLCCVQEKEHPGAVVQPTEHHEIWDH
jgi:hypothetical protein